MTINAQQLRRAVNRFEKHARKELRARWRKWPIDLSKGEVHEVIGGLLARQVTLATALVQDPLMWNGHIAPIILRCMVEVHIAIAWTLRDPLDRSRRFIRYGLGQIKLQIEHRKASWQGSEPDPRDKIMVEALETWLDRQRYSFLTEVNVGSWSDIPVREMAAQAGILDFYNYAYTPFSAAVHSMWHHVSRYNLEPCRSPLHRFHRIPIIPRVPTEPEHAILAAKYMNKSFATFDEVFGVSVETAKSYDLLYLDFTKLFGTKPRTKKRKKHLNKHSK
jgi:hypothetical protein